MENKDYKIIMKAFLVLAIYLMANPIMVFIHEYWHALVALCNGGIVTEVVVAFDQGKCTIVYMCPKSQMALPLFFDTLAGGLSVTVLLIALGAFYRPIIAFSGVHIVYTIWEVLYIGTATWQTFISRAVLFSMLMPLLEIVTFTASALFGLWATKQLFKDDFF